jgi:hypothetical protein
MQWSPVAGGGFTTGRAWERPQPDSLTTNVAVEDPEPGSLLNLYRRLIHLRKGNEALATGRLTELSTSDPRVVAYLRRAPGHVVLVVANLGAAPAHSVSITSTDGVLPVGTYRTHSLLGGPDAAAVPVGSRGRIAGWVPVARIAPRHFLVLGLTAVSGSAGRAPYSPSTAVPVRTP